MANLLTYASLTQYVVKQIGSVETPNGPERRKGAVERGANVVRVIRRDVGGIGRLVDAGRMSPDAAVTQLTDLALELTSLLFSAGAEHEVWRHWSGICALGRLLVGQVREAAKFGALAGEWAMLAGLPEQRVTSKSVSERVVWALLRGIPLRPEGATAQDEVDAAWLHLASSIPAKDHATTERALKVVADHWMGEDDWDVFHPRSAPDFEPSICAVAALARRDGLEPRGLSAEQCAFLEPGLARPVPVPLWPRTFVDAAHAGHSNGTAHEEPCRSS